jgi:aquaporin Z
MGSKAIVAEVVGTFALIFIGAGAVAVGVGGVVGAAFAHGLVVLTFAYAYGHHSGTHINPAVTFGLFVAGELKAGKMIVYWVAQSIGGILGAAALYYVLGGTGANNLGATMPAEGVSIAQTLVLEAILTFFLVNAILNTAVSGKAGDFAPIAIGLTLAFCILMGGPLTGASLNPVRTLGPALFTGTLGMFWVYLVGTLVGAAGAGLLYRGLLKDDGE